MQIVSFRGQSDYHALLFPPAFFSGKEKIKKNKKNKRATREMAYCHSGAGGTGGSPQIHDAPFSLLKREDSPLNDALLSDLANRISCGRSGQLGDKGCPTSQLCELWTDAPPAAAAAAAAATRRKAHRTSAHHSAVKAGAQRRSRNDAVRN